nr:ABC transporter permease subunit [Bacillus velezensis]
MLFTAGLTTPRLNFTDLNPFSESSPFNISGRLRRWRFIYGVSYAGNHPDAEAIANGGSAVLVISVLLFNLCARWLGSVIYKKLTAN